MRSIRLGRALVAAATILVLTPAGASAAPRSKHKVAAKGCHPSLFVHDPYIATGEQVEIEGAVPCAATNQTVTVYEHTGGTPGFKVIGTPTIQAGGLYTLPPVTLEVDSSFYVSFNGARSAIRRVKVAPLVTFEIKQTPTGPPIPQTTPLLTGRTNAVTVEGTVTPVSDKGAEVVLQREVSTGNEEWHAIQRGRVEEGGVYKLTHTFIVPGDANLRVIVRPSRRPSDRFSFRGESPQLSYQVSQAENPSLLIESSLDPAPFEAPYEIKGVLAKKEVQTVTLEAHPRGNPGFAVIEPTKTDGEGKYKFSVPHAVRNTFYKVTGAGTSSAILYQGVSYLLSAVAPPSTAAAKTPVTFEGTVTPGRPGHHVYLERQDGFGIHGFHVVARETVTSTMGLLGIYKFTHFMVGSGNEVFRIHVPGDPENQGAFSPQFTINVTPSTAATLRPVKQSVLPSEGQH